MDVAEISQAVAIVFSLTISTSADYFNERPFHAGIPALVATVCFIVEAAITNNAARYTILCFGAAGIWTTVPIMLAYLANTISHPNEKRAISQAMYATISSQQLGLNCILQCEHVRQSVLCLWSEYRTSVLLAVN